MPDLNAYLERIGYRGALDPTLATLTALHRAHLFAIPYENLDIHRGRTLSLDLPVIFDKLVTDHRGGWCYEMNGLLAWALDEIGFKVTLLASGVKRAFEGDGAEGQHLILKVDLDPPYLVDVGFGNGLLEPIPLEPGAYVQGFLAYHLLRDGERWFFQNHPDGGPGFVFTLQPRTMPYFAEMCRYLQTSPESGFVRTTVCCRFTPQGLIELRGAVLRTVSAQGVSDHVIEDQRTYEHTLADQFDLHLPDAADLWRKVWERHQIWAQS